MRSRMSERIKKKRDVNNEDKLYRLTQGPLIFDDDVEETKGNQKTVKDATTSAVLPLLALAVICIVGMIWLNHKRQGVARVYIPKSVMSEDRSLLY
ncbi:hypothetical protein AWC38_SpisGene13467 [Stylophora pistillata]|uniref:Uncharacterized protein n=1 Tax=Stylophora pistillata TaxID=50429 RepID=A0A2B4RWM7_STYPI|nr:hypothetical protein AWC38_SpisGene13467 [Stylophora pistillata]